MAGRVKPGYTREFSGIPEKYPERARRHGALWVSCLGGVRLLFHVSATFLSFFRTTTPQLSHNFRKSSSHRPRCGSKGQVLSTSFWRGLRFLRCFRQNPVFLGMGSASWRVQSAISQGIGTFWSLETQNFARPYKIVALGWSPARNFRRLSAFRDHTANFGKTFAKVCPLPSGLVLGCERRERPRRSLVAASA